MLKLMLSALIAFLVIPFLQATSGGFNCEHEIEVAYGICECWYVRSIYEIFCQNDIHSVSVRINPGLYALFECPDNEEDYGYLIPKLELGNISCLKIKRCQMSGKRALEKFGGTNVTTLIIEGNAMRNTLSRQHFQGLVNVQKLVLSNNKITELPEDTFDEMPNIQSLDLRSNQFRLPVNIFKKLEHLNILDLGFNNIKTIEDGLFRNQKKLRHLLLWGNKLRNFNKKSFEGVASMTVLDLNSNEIAELQPDVFSLLPNLSKLFLNANNFTELPQELFLNNKKLKYVTILENRVPLESLPNKLFANLPQIESIQICCGLKFIPEDVFKGSSNLKTIVFSRNNISSLPPKVFENQWHLFELDLSKNQLNQLSDELFLTTSALSILRLSFNNLQNISASIFKNLERLQELYIDNNNLLNINYKAFGNAESLQIIRLENNHLSFEELFESKDSPFKNLNKLRVLNLRNNKIMKDFKLLIANGAGMEELDLDLSYNNINEILYDDLQFLSKKITVNLSHNNISSINLKDLENTALMSIETKSIQPVKVYLNDNPLKCDCLIYHFIRYLNGKMKSIVKTYLELVPGVLKCDGSNVSVTSLDSCDVVCPVNENEITCPDNCFCMERVCNQGLVINCSNSGLSIMPDLPVVTNFRLNITELHVENNDLKSLPSRLDTGYAEVSALYAQNNSISALLLDNLPENLKFIDLRNNEIEYLDEQVINYIRSSNSLEQIYLAHNPWSCSCKLFSLVNLIHDKQISFIDHHLMKCADGSTFETLIKETLCFEHWITIICISTTCLGLFVAMLAAFYYKYQKEINMWLYSKKILLSLVTEDSLDKDKIYDAFVSYSHKDEDFVTEQLVPTLESDPMSFKICVHIRDWIPGELIPEQIVESVENSRRTIIVLSESFVESTWGRTEFMTAYTKALVDGRARVIVILYGDIGNVDNLHPVLQAYLKSNTYVKWGDKWFWDKLRFAMPRGPKVKGSRKEKKFSIPLASTLTQNNVNLHQPVRSNEDGDPCGINGENESN